MSEQYWLMKSEPDVYSWDDLVAEKEGTWDGVRNHAAALNMKTMKKGDLAFFYHSNIGVEVVGIIKISKEAFIDPTDEKGKFVAVKGEAGRKPKKTVPLETGNANPQNSKMGPAPPLHLSVGKVRPEEWAEVLQMAGEKA
ncbi:EVE domain-containing protein [uncultured Sphingorhabdus sp.]|uniref:EVE domain-containing protein n=1 Tax=uncultured Sphingorhabdus sp. TaxID=1686106 RepID=UPI00260A8A96|nr:EVE domain-containing protein [uncultured Sphingorhabdus sp.]